MQVLTASELESIFSNMEQIHALSSQLLLKLERKFSRWHTHATVGDDFLFVVCSDFLRLHCSVVGWQKNERRHLQEDMFTLFCPYHTNNQAPFLQLYSVFCKGFEQARCDLVAVEDRPLFRVREGMRSNVGGS